MPLAERRPLGLPSPRDRRKRPPNLRPVKGSPAALSFDAGACSRFGVHRVSHRKVLHTTAYEHPACDAMAPNRRASPGAGPRQAISGRDLAPAWKRVMA